jgi:FG-GAP-like repeat
MLAGCLIGTILLSSLGLGGGNGFLPPARYASRAGQAVLVHDLDGDGFPEIIASGNHTDELPAFSLFANRGDGTFADERLIAGSFGERLEDAGDVNGDGVPDLIAANYWANGISIYAGRPSLQFDGPVFLDTATHGGPSRITDYDRDGIPDLVSLSFGSGNPVRVHLFRGNHNGTLAPKITTVTDLANGVSPSTRLINGMLEMLVAEHSGHLALLRFGAGTVAVTRIEAGPGIDLNSVFADVNGDGVADIVDTNDSESGPDEPVFITLATADGGFLQRRPIGRPRHLGFAALLRAGDLDGDGRVDLLVGDFRATSLYFYRGDGAGGFDEGVAIDAGGEVNDFTLADVNADGAIDIVTANNDHSISVVINRGRTSPPRRRAISR